MSRSEINKSVLAGFFSTATIGALTLLTYKTEFGVFLIASFGSSMVLLFGYPESPFAQPKNVLFGHFLCTLIGIIFVTLFKITQDRTIFFLTIGIAVGFSVMLMMALKITHPPAGGNTIVVMLTQNSFQFLIFPIMVGAITIIIGGVIYNRFILKKNYPLKWF